MFAILGSRGHFLALKLSKYFPSHCAKFFSGAAKKDVHPKVHKDSLKMN